MTGYDVMATHIRRHSSENRSSKTSQYVTGTNQHGQARRKFPYSLEKVVANVDEPDNTAQYTIVTSIAVHRNRSNQNRAK